MVVRRVDTDPYPGSRQRITIEWGTIWYAALFVDLLDSFVNSAAVPVSSTLVTFNLVADGLARLEA